MNISWKVIIFVGCIFILSGCWILRYQKIQGVYHTESTLIQEWIIEEYSVKLSWKTGPSGPSFREYDIYSDAHLGKHGFYEKDTCKLLFREKNEKYVEFDLCNNNKSVITPDKNNMEIDQIDSVNIKNLKTGELRQLKERQIKSFATEWSNMHVNGYKRLGISYQYQILVYMSDQIRTFFVLNQYITEHESWSYFTTHEKYFENLWMKSDK